MPSQNPLYSQLDRSRNKGYVQALTPNAPIATKVVCFSRLLKYLRSLYCKQCGPRSDCSYRAVCSGSTLFASILNSSEMLGNYLQQTTLEDNIFRCIFFLGALRVNSSCKVQSSILTDKSRFFPQQVFAWTK